MAKINQFELCQKYLVNDLLEKVKKQLNQCKIELTKQSRSYLIATLSLNQLDPCLQEYVYCQRKYLSIRNKDQLIKFKDQIHRKELFKTITTTTPITNNQVKTKSIYSNFLKDILFYIFLITYIDVD